MARHHFTRRHFLTNLAAVFTVGNAPLLAEDRPETLPIQPCALTPTVDALLDEVRAIIDRVDAVTSAVERMQGRGGTP